MYEDFEQNHFFLTAKGIYRTGRDSISLRNCMAYFDRCYENINYFDWMAFLLSAKWNIWKINIT